MVSSKYELTAIVELEALPDILEQVELIDLKEIKDHGKELKTDKNPRVRTSKYRKASRFKGSLTGEELITKLVADGRIHTASEISKEFLSEGFGHNSSSPRISSMVQKGQLTMLGDGKYQRAGAKQKS